MTVLPENKNSKQIIIHNGELRTPYDGSEIIIEENHITINPAKNSDIVLSIINEQSIQQTVTVNFFEENASVAVYGLYDLRDQHKVEITTLMNHAVPHCTSNQLWKGVMDGQSKALFEGKIIVAPHAQKTVANLSNKNLLLSKTAEVSTRPFLEIDANDVQCSHGATVGCLDPNAIFYLRSRGILECEARGMLIEAFKGVGVGVGV